MTLHSHGLVIVGCDFLLTEWYSCRQHFVSPRLDTRDPLRGTSLSARKAS